MEVLSDRTDYSQTFAEPDGGLPARGVFNLAALAAGEEIIICESPIDALAFWCAGFRHVTASYGAGGFIADHQRAFAEHGIRRVLIAYDRDDAVAKAAHALASDLMASGVECFRVQFPAGADANDLAVSSRNPADALGRAVRSAAWMGAGPGPARRRDAPLPEPAAGAPEPGPALVSAAGPPPSAVSPGTVPLSSATGPPPAQPGAAVDPAAVSPAPAAAGEPVPRVSGRRRPWRSGSAGGGSAAWSRRRASTCCG